MLGIKMNLNYFDENFFFKWTFLCVWIHFIWEFYLRRRQLRVVNNTAIMPDSLIGIITRENFAKSRLYTLDKHNFAIISEIFDIFVTTAFIWFYGFPYFWNLSGKILDAVGFNHVEYIILHNAAFAGVLNLFNSIIKFPFSVYGTFVIEGRHGFNNQTVGFFILDHIKSLFIGQIFMGLAVAGVTYIIQIGGPYLFVYLFGFTTLFTFFIMTIYPEVIAPLFDKYTPLPEGPLRTDIEKLAASISFPLYKIYLVEGSKRSSHSNAYLYGLFNFKRIVLYDTLFKNTEGKGCENDEIVAILGHELGHWKLSHVVKKLAWMMINLLVTFIIFQLLIDHYPVYKALGFQAPAPTFAKLLIVFQFVLAPFLTIFGFYMGIVSRRHEFDADNFAKKLGRGNTLKASLIKLNLDNLGFPLYDPWFSAWQNSHPPLLERLEALDKTD